MKKIIGLLIVLVVLVLGGYYGMGVMTERTLKRDIELINQSNGLLVQIKRYDRSWFTSSADLQWKIRIPERVVKDENGQSKVEPAQDYTLDMPLTIYHGPVMFAKDGVHFGLGYAHAELIMTEEVKKEFLANFSENSTVPKVTLNVRVNYLNRSQFIVALPEFTLLLKEGNGQLKWLGMNSSVTLTSNLDHIDGDMTIDGIQLSKDNMNAVVSEVSSEYNLYQAENGLYLGKASFSLPSVLVKNSEEKIFELTKFNIETKSDISDGLFNSSLSASLGSLYANGQAYGPGKVSLAIQNLDAEVLARINEQANKIQSASDQERQQLMFALLPELPKLVSKGAELQVSELSFVMPEGNIEGSLTVSLPKGESSNPFELIQKIHGEGQLKLPEKVVVGALKETAKQQLMKQPDLQDALAKQMQQDASAQPATVSDDTQSKPTEVAPSSDSKATTSVKQEDGDSSHNVATPAEQPVTNQMTLAELDQKAEVKAREKLASLIDAGALQKQENEYVIHVALNDGQLSVNGKPFNPAMIQF